jgi:tRNA (cytidine/uridine-2'-O-)-methyltransferase
MSLHTQLIRGLVALPLLAMLCVAAVVSPKSAARCMTAAVAADNGAMFDVVLFQPEIPPNTGNVIRLCANVGARLHLVEPLGFSMDDRQLKRAGLDYHELATVTVHRDWSACEAALSGRRMYAVSTRGHAHYAEVRYEAGDVFVFGAETAGLPAEFLARFPPAQTLRLPMRPGNRSLNLSNAVAVVVFEAWRQQGFGGAGISPPVVPA